MDNLKVGWRLAIGLALILGVAACATLVVFARTIQTDEAVREFERSAQISALLNELSANGRENMFIVANLLLDSSSGAVAEAKGKLDVNRQANQKTLAALDSLMASGPDLAALAQVKEKRSNFIAARNRMIELYGGNQREAALNLFRNDVISTVTQYQQALSTVRDYQQSRVSSVSQLALNSVQESRIAIVVGSLVALLIAVIVGFVSTRSVARPIGQAVVIANGIAADRLDGAIPTGRRDEVGQLFDAMKRMQDSLLARRTEDRRTIDTMTATKHALDVASSAIMMADAEGVIRYINGALQHLCERHELELRRTLPEFRATEVVGQRFDACFGAAAAALGTLDALSQQHEGRLELGGRTFALTINPIYSEAHQRLGTVLTWLDRTDDLRAETEVADLVRAAAAGDFAPRIGLQGREGYFRIIGVGLNSLMDTCQSGLSEVGRVLGALARGDLTQSITRDFEGEFAELKRDVNQTVATLKETVEDMHGASEAINVAAHEIASGNNDLSQRTEQQAASLEETAASVEELTATVHQNAENARQANQLAIGASDVAVKGGTVVGQVVETMKSISDSSRRISDIIGVIDSIAFQTNILALNAAVEAARAGEQGRGFAVVAAEVRSLAQRCTAAAKEIKDLISESVGKVDDGTRLVDSAGHTMKEIVDSVRRVTDIMSEISAASAEQSAGFQQVNSAITQMDQSTQQNAALVEEAAAAAESMKQQAEKLSETVGIFVLGEARAAPIAVPRVPFTKPTVVRSAPPRAAPSAGRPAGAPGKGAGPAPAPSRTTRAARAPIKAVDLPEAVTASTESEDWEEF